MGFHFISVSKHTVCVAIVNSCGKITFRVRKLRVQPINLSWFYSFIGFSGFVFSFSYYLCTSSDVDYLFIDNSVTRPSTYDLRKINDFYMAVFFAFHNAANIIIHCSKSAKKDTRKLTHTLYQYMLLMHDT